MPTMEKVNYKGKEYSVEDFLHEIFEDVPAEKIKFSIADLKNFADEKIFNDKNLERFSAVETAQDLKDFILHPTTQGIGVKTLLKTCLADKNISFNEAIIKGLKTEHLSIIFENIFDFGKNVESEKNLNLPTDSATEQKIFTPPFQTPPKKIDLNLDSMQLFLKNCKFEKRDDIEVTDFELLDKMPVTLMNKFYMIVPKDLQIYHGAMAIITKSEPFELVAVGSFQPHEGKTHILLKQENIDYELFKQQSGSYVVIFPQEAQAKFESGESYSGRVYLAHCRVRLKDLEEAQATLCIDFGTSNTTVGSYGIKNPAVNEPEIVEFLDETGDNPQKRKMFPTMVYVESCKEGKVNYLFGYDALKKVIDKDYNPTASVFNEIKRWINNINDVENIVDEEEYNAQVTHREIIHAYLEHILNLAEQYFQRKFTKLHFTAPVKLKDSFIEEVKKMFDGNERTVSGSDKSIDEGIAIIYDHITEQMKKKKGKDKKSVVPNENEKIFIIDCGGGTTDLASCEYSLDAASKKLNIVTKFENGDSNFGGNNVTFRILQLLKIKLARKLENGSDFSIQNLIDDENKILYDIDQNYYAIDEKNLYNQSPKDDKEIFYNAYKKFDEEYEKAEKFVPTKFGSENLPKKKSKLKRNFYYLWQIAEAYKIQFYRASMDFVSVNFSNPEDRKIGIPDDNKYYLFVDRSGNGELEKLSNPMSGIEITNNDIHRLLFADIYSLLKTVLYTYDNNEHELLKYHHYKLSGQSCKITLFNELLKEFIPGKYLRYGDGRKDSPDSSELKLACINGSICYTRDKEYSEIVPEIKTENPKLIYDVCKVDVGMTVETYMLKKGQAEIKPEIDVLSSEASRAKYVVLSQNGKNQNTIDFTIEKNPGRQMNTTEIKIEIKKYTNDDNGEIGKYLVDKLTDLNVKENEKVFALFALPSKTGYGFYIFCFRVEGSGGRYHLTQNPKYYSYENTALETFFNGNR